MSIIIHTEPLAYTEFRDFIISSANWFVPSLLQMPNLDEWILKMYHNGSIYYTISGSNIISSNPQLSSSASFLRLNVLSSLN